jgi:hypothetical protein
MPDGDRIDNKRILMSPAVIVVSRLGKEVPDVMFRSTRIQLALVALASVIGAAAFGYGCPWGP